MIYRPRRGRLLQQILNEEDDHMDGIEAFQGQIEQMSLQVFLTTQVEG